MDSDLAPIVPFVVWSALVSLCASAGLILCVCVLRLRVAILKRRLAAFYAAWGARLRRVEEDVDVELPPVARWQTYFLLDLWVAECRGADAVARERLCVIARRMQLDAICLRWIGNLSRGGRRRMLSIIALGYLREPRAWDTLCRIAAEDDPLQSMTAAWALVRQDPQRSVRVLVALLQKRDDWSHVGMTGILREAGVDLFEGPLSEAMASGSPVEIPRLLRVLSALLPSRTPDVVRRLLASARDPEVIGRCLEALVSHEDAGYARAHLESGDYHLRVHAASALGRIGSEDDIPALCRLLGDDEWWVRHRAALAIGALVGFDARRLAELQQAQAAPRAAAALGQVAAEALPS